MKRFLLLSLAAMLLLITVVLASIANSFLRLQGLVDECPLTEELSANDTLVPERKRQQAVRFFGIDPDAGPAGARRLFGRPQRTIVVPQVPSLENIHVCSCIYDGLRLTFFNDVLGVVEITGRRWSFPMPVHIGDTEQRVYEFLGRPRMRREYGVRQVQLYYDVGAVLSIEMARGAVVKILWY